MEKRVDHLASRGPVVTLADGNFTRYTEGKSRPYSVVVLFTALGAQYKCTACRTVEEPYVKVAEAYSRQYNIREAEHKVVFARIDIGNGGTTFGNLGVNTAPRVFVVPRGTSFPQARGIADFEATNTLSRSDGMIDKYLDILGKVTGARVVIVADSSGLLPAALLLGVILGVAAHFLADVPSRVMTAVRHKGLWFAVSMGCYMTGVGGMIYCIIRNAKTHGYHQDGATAMMSPGGRDQFWYEGMVVAVLYLFMSAAILGVYYAASWKRVPSPLRTAVVLACITVLCYVVSVYMALYAKKTPWYNLKEMIPPVVSEFHKGPLKRKHGLLRRLVRLSYLWLDDYTGFWTFCTKLKMLLWDYLVRRLDTALQGWMPSS
ncbi:unnamed protein product [Ectocarpus sp. 13 AM-2016]